MSSTAEDPRGNPVGTRHPQAQAAADRALWRMMSFYGSPLADLDEAIAAAPDWLLPRVMKAGWRLSLAEPSQVDIARAEIEAAAKGEADAPARERAHLAAVQQLLEGRWHQACETWDELLLAHPRDPLALQWAQQWDLFRGDAASLRARPARSLPEWNEGDRLYPFVLGLHAFGLQENHLYPQAEDVGRRALQGDDAVPWAIYAVAQVMEMQGRFDEGAAWLRQHQPQWAEGNGFAAHLWWQMGLFRLEALDDAGALRLVDSHLAGAALHSHLHRVDAAALLWRLHLLGIDVVDRFRALADDWPLADGDAGYYALHDLHVLVALAGAGDLGRADRWVARCAERAMQPEDARRSNHAVAREVGLPLMRAVLALVRDDPSSAAQTLYAMRRQAHRLGGSQARRDLIDQTLLAACAAGGGAALGRAVLNERRMAKPVTPLTRHWAQRLGIDA